MKKALITFTALALLISCSEAKTKTDNSPTETVQIETAATKTEVVEINDRSTLEGFYNILKKAVATRDIETLKTLYAEGTSRHDFDSPDEQELLKESKFSDIILSPSNWNDRILYELTLTYAYEEELDENGDVMEASTFTIMMEKNKDGNYEIFVISFPG